MYLLIYCLLFITATDAQNFQHKLFTTKDGLSNDNITCLAKDKNGFLWVGTSNGLNRFDGSAFDKFFYNPTDSTSIQNNEIQDILVTDNNQLWVSTINGISNFDAPTQSFKNYAPDTLVLPKIGYAFPKLYKANDGNIWVGSWYDLLIFNETSKQFTSSGWYKFAAGLNIKNANNTRVLIQSIVAKSDAELWVLSTYGLFSVNIKTKQFAFHENNYINDYYGCSIGCVDDKNTVYINTYNKGIVYYDSNNDSWHHYDLPPIKVAQNKIINQVCSIKKFNADTLIYCSNDKLYFFDATNKKTILPLNVENNKGETFLSIRYSGILKDDKITWVQSNNGLLLIKPFFAKFEEQIVENTQYLGRCFFTGKANEFIMHNGDKEIFYYNNISKLKTFITTHNYEKISEELLYYLKINKDTALITTENGVYILVKNKATPIQLPPKKFEQNPYITRNIVRDNENNFYIRCRKQGIIQYNVYSQKTQFLNCIPSIANNEYSALFFDNTTNNLWIGLQNKGVYVLNSITKKIKHYLLNTAPSQRGGSIYCIAQSKDGIIYLSDMYNGLFAYNNKTEKFTRYTNKDGLAANNCFWLSIYNDKMWVGTGAGISLMDLKSNSFKNYKMPVENNTFSEYFISDSLGNNYSTFNNKMLAWNTSNFITAADKGKIYFRQCKLNNLTLPIHNDYHFKHFENNIHFTLGYLLLDNENDVTFEYKLNEGNWIDIGADNKISFSNLSPNSYILETRLKNDVKQILQISFEINPPFYKTWWFFLLLALSVTALIYTAFKRRISTVRKQASLSQKIIETEIMAFKAQMNPHFIFNCISSIDNYILQNDTQNASAYLNKFAKLIRNILDNSMHDVVPFWKDWQTLTYYVDLEKLRNNNSFQCIITADDVLLNGHYKIPPLVIQPYVENAILHGLKPLLDRKGILSINASLHEGFLIYTIKDNGVGRRSNSNENNSIKNQASYGMDLTEQRINLFNGQNKNAVIVQDLKDENGKPAGTLITISLKV